MAIEHRPPDNVIIPDNEMVYCLAGPIQGAPDWQRQAFGYINAITDTGIHVANPRRETLDKETFDYNQQVEWEKILMQRAATFGAVPFWFAAQDLTLPYEPGRAYAKTTIKEFMRCIGWRDRDRRTKLAIGIEPSYADSERYLRTCADEHELVVHETLEAACQDLVKG